MKPGKKAKIGTKISFGEGLLIGEVVESIAEEGNRLIQFTYEGICEEILDKLGQVPTAARVTPSAEGQEPLPDRLCKA